MIRIWTAYSSKGETHYVVVGNVIEWIVALLAGGIVLGAVQLVVAAVRAHA